MRRHPVVARFRVLVLVLGVLAFADRVGRAAGPDDVFSDPTLLLEEAVRKELKLSEDQAARSIAVAKSFVADRDQGVAELRGKIQDRSKPAQKRMDQIRELTVVARLKLKEILSESQITRLGQISIQTQGLLAFLNANVLDALQATPEQRQEIRGLAQKAMAERPMLRDFRLKHPGSTPELWQAAIEALDQNAVVTILEKLKPDQKSKWAELIGSPYKP